MRSGAFDDVLRCLLVEHARVDTAIVQLREFEDRRERNATIAAAKGPRLQKREDERRSFGGWSFCGCAVGDGCAFWDGCAFGDGCAFWSCGFRGWSFALDGCDFAFDGCGFGAAFLAADFGGFCTF